MSEQGKRRSMRRPSIRRVLLVHDQTAASDAAKEWSIAFARRHAAALTALVVIEKELVASTPSGADSLSTDMRSLLIHAEAEASVATKQFCQRARKADVACETKVVTQDAFEAITDASAGHDVVVMGFDASFGISVAGTPSPLVSRVLRDSARPVVVLSTEANQTGCSVIAYDGSISAMRVLQLYCLTRASYGEVVIVVSVQAQELMAERHCQQASEYLRSHGYTAVPRPIQSLVDPAIEIVTVARAENAGLIVAGAFGSRGWSSWLAAATTRELLARSPIPLFFLH